jgi:hypothetical protein
MHRSFPTNQTKRSDSELIPNGHALEMSRFEDIKPDVSSRDRLPAFAGLRFPSEVGDERREKAFGFAGQADDFAHC